MKDSTLEVVTEILKKTIPSICLLLCIIVSACTRKSGIESSPPEESYPTWAYDFRSRMQDVTYVETNDPLPTKSSQSHRRVERLVRPIAPASLELRDTDASTTLKIEILENGDISSVTIHESSGHLDLDRYATEAVRQWQFVPADKKEIRLIRVRYVF